LDLGEKFDTNSKNSKIGVTSFFSMLVETL
jgi:hypothetical protein